ncbi:hypothetical protein BC939DRAFT_440584 [Gamsiella multidivaricata]|uniref:uncharacterized protein n=1 Tax=Gamsiella multidivaricata TaxID=101098 RepID=UPI0022200CC0|nr:uncharacterized protein BC939DRAFT_440584 [Gamsiella multidivaricata]KAG0366524.1 hypothetical protein BGZ54_005234 [Gamsiella multidivaricata]KAI7829789.1 hypothetical protein BC939DRAFT_440584 [Gamsiella multidivaricata]
MTHLSDLSYVQRGVCSAWFYGWFIIYVFRWDRFEALRLRRIARFELRSVVTLLILIALALQLSYDIGSARLKYLEGFWINPRTKEIQSKPAQAWSPEDMVHVEPLYYTLACCLAFENSCFFLLLAFWSYISKSVTKSSFMSSFEFKVNIVCSCIVIVLFPTVQYLFRKDFVYREVVPQILFSILTFITGVLGIRTHFKLVVLIKNAREIMNETTFHVLQKLEYFKDMNLILTFGLFGTSIPLGIMSADGLTSNPVIATNKFASDFLITNLNFFEFIIWVTLVLIFYPRKTGTGSPFDGGSGGSSNMVSLSAYNRNSRDAHLPRFNDVMPQDNDFYCKVEPVQDLENPVWSVDRSAGPRHQRTLSNESRYTTHTPIPLPPAAVTVAASTSKSNSKPELISTTIYYQDGLAKAQQEQQQQQDQEFYSRSLQNGSLPNPNGTSLPHRSFSQSSHYSLPTPHQPHRSGSQASQRPLVPKASKRGTRVAHSSMDFRPSRDYPSLAQEASNWDQSNVSRSQSSGSSRPLRQQQQQPVYHDETANTARAASAMAYPYQRTSLDSDREIIQIAYVRSMSEDNSASHSSFYEALGREATAANASAAAASRPYSPRHF